jgi:hypothetical protein
LFPEFFEDFEERFPDTKFATLEEAYPTFLDRFDRYGWGFYGLGPYNNHHNWMGRAGAKNGEILDPLDDMDFLSEYSFRFEPWLDPTKLDNSDGIVKNNGVEWMVSQAKKRNLPIGFRVYGEEGGSQWSAGRRFTDLMEQPGCCQISGSS